jgi:hypothetical protein
MLVLSSRIKRRTVMQPNTTTNKRKLSGGGQTKKQRKAKQPKVSNTVPLKFTPKVEKSEHSSLKIQTFPEQYNQLLDEKVAKVKVLFSDLPDFPSDVEVFDSPKVRPPSLNLGAHWYTGKFSHEDWILCETPRREDVLRDV